MTDFHPETMQAAHYDAPGGPEVLHLVELPMPQPGPGEVLVKVAFAGVNRPDVIQRMGFYPPPPGASPVPGLEISGEVVALGEGASRTARPEYLRAGFRRRLCAVLLGRG